MTKESDARPDNLVAWRRDLRAGEQGSTPWKRATYALGAIVVILMGILLWNTHTTPDPAVGLYNAWIQQTRLMGEPGRPLQLLYGDSVAAAGMTEAGRQMLGAPNSMQGHVAQDLYVIAGGLSSVLVVMQDRGKGNPEEVGPSLRAFRALLRRRVLDPLPGPVRSGDQLPAFLPALDKAAAQVGRASTLYESGGIKVP